jgi:hypothetical protein
LATVNALLTIRPVAYLRTPSGSQRIAVFARLDLPIAALVDAFLSRQIAGKITRCAVAVFAALNAFICDASGARGVKALTVRAVNTTNTNAVGAHTVGGWQRAI